MYIQLCFLYPFLIPLDFSIHTISTLFFFCLFLFVCCEVDGQSYIFLYDVIRSKAHQSLFCSWPYRRFKFIFFWLYFLLSLHNAQFGLRFVSIYAYHNRISVIFIVTLCVWIWKVVWHSWCKATHSEQWRASENISLFLCLIFCIAFYHIENFSVSVFSDVTICGQSETLRKSCMRCSSLNLWWNHCESH